jgi:hypothetical protein
MACLAIALALVTSATSRRGHVVLVSPTAASSCGIAVESHNTVLGMAPAQRGGLATRAGFLGSPSRGLHLSRGATAEMVEKDKVGEVGGSVDGSPVDGRHLPIGEGGIPIGTSVVEIIFKETGLVGSGDRSLRRRGSRMRQAVVKDDGRRRAKRVLVVRDRYTGRGAGGRSEALGARRRHDRAERRIDKFR